MTYEVYGLIDPRSGSVFYVGCSKNARTRLHGHHTDPGSAAWSTCQRLRNTGFKPVLCIFGRFENRPEARTLEAQLTMLLPDIVNSKSSHILPVDDTWRFVKGGEDYRSRGIRPRDI